MNYELLLLLLVVVVVVVVVVTAAAVVVVTAAALVVVVTAAVVVVVVLYNYYYYYYYYCLHHCYSFCYFSSWQYAGGTNTGWQDTKLVSTSCLLNCIACEWYGALGVCSAPTVVNTAHHIPPPATHNMMPWRGLICLVNLHRRFVYVPNTIMSPAWNSSGHTQQQITPPPPQQ